MTDTEYRDCLAALFGSRAVALTPEQAEKIRQRFFELYSGSKAFRAWRRDA